jgi:HSP20 family molecular chaperone IbpA
MDVAQFQPNEITVKTLDNIVMVEGKHEERQDDYGYISRQFSRKYNLPQGYDSSSVVSTISSDGVLTIKAPLPHKGKEGNARMVEIQQTGPAKSSIKQNPENDMELKSKK